VQPQLSSAEGDLSQQQAEERRAYANAQNLYGHDNGLIARWQALTEIESTSSTVGAQVWLLEGLIIAIDLSAVIAKLTSKTPVL
jgi:hypothetical protein